MDTKTKPTTASDDDSSSAVVRAAAWAWYQRGSGAASDASAREYDATRRRGDATPRPSRYKLEAATRLADRDTAVLQQERSSGNSTTTSLSLLDAYEIQSISRHLDKLIEHSRDGVFSDDDDDESVASLASSTPSSSLSSAKAKRANVLGMRRVVRGLWLRHAAAVCGVRDGGVVEIAGKSPRRSTRRDGGHVWGGR